MNKRIQIQDIQPLKESFRVPDGYFDSLANQIEAKKGDRNVQVKLEDIPKLEESYQVPDGYFEGLVDKIEERKLLEDNVVSFRSTRIRIWGGMVAAACIAIVVVSVINFGGASSQDKLADGKMDRIKNIPDKEIASLMNERDDEFELTEDEIIDVIDHATKQSESTAIINFLQDDGTMDDAGDENFIESI
jgi:hypothetical protein